MAKISLYLDTRTKSKDEVYTVKIAVRNKKSVFYIPTSVRVEKSKWMDGMIIEGNAMDKRLNKILDSKVRELRLKLLSIETTQGVGDLKAKDLAALIEPSVADMMRDREEEVTVGMFFDRFIGRKEKRETKNVYLETKRKMERFCNLGKLRFEDITYSWLCDFEVWMTKRGNAVNTRAITLKSIRAVYNAAIKEGVAQYEDYPFRNFKIRKEETEKRSLTIEELRGLRGLGVTEGQKRAVDVFFLIFYLCGINAVDLLELPPLGRDGRIRYRRSKTGVLCEMAVPKEAIEIIERYKGKEHLVNFIEVFKDKSSFLRQVNRALQLVGDVYHVKVRCGNGGMHDARRYVAWYPRLTSYWARHTWATIAADIDVPDAVIDAALGHRSPYPMTDVYVRRNRRKVDEAVRRVIDYVNGEE